MLGSGAGHALVAALQYSLAEDPSRLHWTSLASPRCSPLCNQECAWRLWSLARAGQHLHTAAAVTAAHGRAAGASGSVAELESAVAGDAEEARVAGARPKKEKARGW